MFRRTGVRGQAQEIELVNLAAIKLPLIVPDCKIATPKELAAFELLLQNIEQNLDTAEETTNAFAKETIEENIFDLEVKLTGIKQTNSELEKIHTELKTTLATVETNITDRKKMHYAFFAAQKDKKSEGYKIQKKLFELQAILTQKLNRQFIVYPPEPSDVNQPKEDTLSALQLITNFIFKPQPKKIPPTQSTQDFKILLLNSYSHEIEAFFQKIAPNNFRLINEHERATFIVLKFEQLDQILHLANETPREPAPKCCPWF